MPPYLLFLEMTNLQGNRTCVLSQFPVSVCPLDPSTVLLFQSWQSLARQIAFGVPLQDSLGT